MVTHLKCCKLLFIISIFFVISCTSNQQSCGFPINDSAPHWVWAPMSESDGYYYFYGNYKLNGDDIYEARKKSVLMAREEVSLSLSTHIWSEISSKVNSRDNSSSYDFDKEISLKLESYSSNMVKNVIVDDYWYDNGNCSVWSKVKIRKDKFNQLNDFASDQILTSLDDKIEK